MKRTHMAALSFAGLGLLCLANIICFFPDSLLAKMDETAWREYNASHLATACISAFVWGLCILRAQEKSIPVLGVLGHLFAVAGIGLAIFDMSSQLVIPIGALCGFGLIPAMAWWFGMLSYETEGRIALIQASQVLISECIFILLMKAIPWLAPYIALASALASCTIAFITWSSLRKHPQANLRPTRLSTNLLRPLQQNGAPIMGFAVVAFLYGVFAGIAMGRNGSPFSLCSAAIGAPIGAIVFLTWSRLSKTKSYGFAVGVMFATVAALVPFIPLDASVLIFAIGFQGCGLLLFTLCITVFSDEPRVVMSITGIIYGCGHALFLAGLFVPGRFGITSPEQFLGSNPIVILVIYAACFSIIVLIMRQNQTRKKELDALSNKLREQSQEQTVLAKAILERSDERYAIACRIITSQYGLTKREAEVLSLLARGRDIAFICESLCLARNTVKGYTKRIYAKLDVHSKQEIIDIVESAMH